MPPMRRLSAASWAASKKPSNDRETPGMSSEPIVKWTLGPKSEVMIAAVVPLKVAWPDVYDGKPGVCHGGVQAGSDAVSGLTTAARGSLIAVTGRQKS